MTYLRLTKEQAFLLIVASNALHIIACVLGNNSFALNVLSIFLIFDVSIYLVVLLNILEKSSPSDYYDGNDEKGIIKSLRNEYRKILQQKKRKLLFKQEYSKGMTLNQDSKSAQRVHLDYLKKIISNATHKE